VGHNKLNTDYQGNIGTFELMKAAKGLVIYTSYTSNYITIEIIKVT